MLTHHTTRAANHELYLRTAALWWLQRHPPESRTKANAYDTTFNEIVKDDGKLRHVVLAAYEDHLREVNRKGPEIREERPIIVASEAEKDIKATIEKRERVTEARAKNARKQKTTRKKPLTAREWLAANPQPPKDQPAVKAPAEPTPSTNDSTLTMNEVLDVFKHAQTIAGAFACVPEKLRGEVLALLSKYIGGEQP